MNSRRKKIETFLGTASENCFVQRLLHRFVNAINWMCLVSSAMQCLKSD